MAVNTTLVKSLLDNLKLNISIIENKDVTLEQILVNEDIQAILDRRMQLAIETCIDIATHLIAGLDLERKERASDAFLFLGEKGIISKELAKKLAEASGFRNILVHEYIKIDYELAYSDLNEKLQDLKGFGKEVVAFLEKQT